MGNDVPGSGGRIGPARNRLLSALSLARRAGKLAVGFDAAEEAVKIKRAKMVVTLSDISERTGRKIAECCRGAGAKALALPVSSGEAARVLGKRAVVAAVRDDGFIQLISSAVEEANGWL